jgi:anti-anti-sigma factor
VEQVDTEAIDNEPLQVVTAWEDSRAVLTIRGDLDLLTCDPLVNSVVDLDGALHTGDSVALDLSGVSFLDAAGYSALVRICEHMDGDGTKVVAVNPGPQVRRFLQLVVDCGYVPPFTIYYDQS